MNGEATQVYIDETGIEHLDPTLQGSSTHYIIVAVIVGPAHQDSVLAGLEAVASRHFQGSPIKSSNVGDNDNRRERVLNDLMALDFTFYAFTCDKTRLTTPGYTFRGSFRKNLHGKVYRAIYRAFPNLHMTADDYGKDAFKDSFRTYIRKGHKHPLLAQPDVEFVPSRANRFIQAADFVAGSLARCVDQKLMSTRASTFLELLRPKAILIEPWPPDPRSFVCEQRPAQDTALNRIITQAGIPWMTLRHDYCGHHPGYYRASM